MYPGVIVCTCLGRVHIHPELPTLLPTPCRDAPPAVRGAAVTEALLFSHPGGVGLDAARVAAEALVWLSMETEPQPATGTGEHLAMPLPSCMCSLGAANGVGAAARGCKDVSQCSQSHAVDIVSWPNCSCMPHWNVFA